MTIAERWADVPAGCICKWAARQAGGWVRVQWHTACPAGHGDQLTLW